MKKKIAMRVASFALCVVFTGLLFGAPKSKAVVTETAIGTAALAGYMTATGVPLTVINGGAATVTSGVASMASSYAAATGAATSGSAWLSSLAAGVSMSPAGLLVLSAAAVVAIGAFVAWYVHDKGLESPGDTAVPLPGNTMNRVYNGVELADIDSVWIDKINHPYALIYLSDDGVYHLVASPVRFEGNEFPNFCNICIYDGSGIVLCWNYSSAGWIGAESITLSGFNSIVMYNLGESLLWTSETIRKRSSSSTCSAPNAVATDPVPAGEVSNQLEVTRSPEFTQPDIGLDPKSATQMMIDLGYPAGTTLDQVAEDVPAQIAVGTLTSTYEMTGTEEGTETTPDEETGIYIPVLSDIKNAVTGLGDSIVNGIMSGLQSLFVPSEAYLEALPTQITDTFDSRTGFLTYPFSLLADFVGRISATSQDWILSWPQISEPFSGAVLFQPGTFNVSSFVRSNVQIKKLYDLWRLLAKVLMSFGLISLCYKKYRSVVGDKYGG